MLERVRSKVSGITEDIGLKLARLGLKADYVSAMGIFLSAFTFYTLYKGYVRVSGLLILASGFLDMIDGAIARATNTASEKGSFMDSVFDRVSDGLILLGMGFPVEDFLMSALAIHSSMMVSYVRAKAESLGVKGTEFSLAGRPERMIIASLACLTNRLELGLFLIALLSYITVGERSYSALTKIRLKGPAEGKKATNR